MLTNHFPESGQSAHHHANSLHAASLQRSRFEERSRARISPSHLVHHLHWELFLASLHGGCPPVLFLPFFFFFLIPPPLPGPQMLPCRQRVSKTIGRLENCTSKICLFRAYFPAPRFAHSSESLQEHLPPFSSRTKGGFPNARARGEETPRCRDPAAASSRRGAPARPGAHAQPPGPHSRASFKSYRCPKRFPLRPELPPALHSSPASLPPRPPQPVPTPWSLSLAGRSPCLARRERGRTSEPLTLSSHTDPPSHPGALLANLGQVEGKFREHGGGRVGLGFSPPARPPQRPPPPHAAGPEENTAPGRPRERAGAGLASDEV